MLQIFQHRQKRIQNDTFQVVRDLIHFFFVDVFVFNLFHDKILYGGLNRFALSDYMGFLRHGWPPVHKCKMAGGRKDLPDDMNRRPHPAIPWQVAPRQSLPLLHRTLLIRFFTVRHLHVENHVGIHDLFIGKHCIGKRLLADVADQSGDAV